MEPVCAVVFPLSAPSERLAGARLAPTGRWKQSHSERHHLIINTASVIAAKKIWMFDEVLKIIGAQTGSVITTFACLGAGLSYETLFSFLLIKAYGGLLNTKRIIALICSSS